MSILIPPAGPGRASRAPLALPRLPSPRQILTQEDWNVVLYNGMASTSSWAALYFVALMTFGNYVLFNLLVAILVEGFQAEVRGFQGTGWPGLHPPPAQRPCPGKPPQGEPHVCPLFRGHRATPPGPTQTRTRCPPTWRRIWTRSETSGPQVCGRAGAGQRGTARPVQGQPGPHRLVLGGRTLLPGSPADLSHLLLSPPPPWPQS